MSAKIAVRLVVLFLLALSPLFGMAQDTRAFELTLEFNGEHHPNASFAYDVAVASESGNVMAIGRASFSGTVGSRILMSVEGRLDKAVRVADVRGLQLLPVSQNLSGTGIGASLKPQVAISRVQFKLGAGVSRTTLVQEEWRLTPSWNKQTWDGSKRVFYIRSADDADETISTVSVQGIVKDTVRKGCRLELRVELVNGKQLVWTGRSQTHNGVSEIVPIFGEAGFYDGTFVLGSPVKRRDILKIALVEMPGLIRKESETLAERIELASYTPDDVEVENFVLSLGARHEGTYVPQVVANEPRWALKSFGMWQTTRLSRAQLVVPFSSPSNLFLCFMTGSDDLRWDPNAQPNLEFSVTLIYKRPGETREQRDRLVGPGFSPDGSKTEFAGYTPKSFFSGKFESHSQSYGLLKLRDRIPVEQLVAVEIEMVKGRNPNRQGGGIGRGDDQWDLRGLWIGANASNERMSVSTFSPDQWSVLSSDYKLDRKLKLGDKVRIPLSVRRSALLRFEVGKGNLELGGGQ